MIRAGPDGVCDASRWHVAWVPHESMSRIDVFGLPAGKPWGSVANAQPHDRTGRREGDRSFNHDA